MGSTGASHFQGEISRPTSALVAWRLRDVFMFSPSFCLQSKIMVRFGDSTLLIVYGYEAVRASVLQWTGILSKLFPCLLPSTDWDCLQVFHANISGWKMDIYFTSMYIGHKWALAIMYEVS